MVYWRNSDVFTAVVNGYVRSEGRFSFSLLMCFIVHIFVIVIALNITLEDGDSVMLFYS